MGDYFAGDIEIGGKISRKDLNELIEKILEGGLKKDYNFLYTRGELVEAFATQKSVSLCDDQAKYGEFPELEAWLIEHKIPFDRHSDARYEYDAVNTYCRVEDNKVILNTLYSTQDGADLLDKGCIGSIVNDSGLTDTEKINELQRIINKVESLPPIEII
jgi:hypothetical protein